MYKYHRVSTSLNLKMIIKEAMRQKSYGELIKEIRGYFIRNYNFLDFQILDSGRQALYRAILQTPPEKTEVIIPIFGCEIVSQVVRKANKTPIYADVDAKTFSIDVKDVENKLSERTAAIIVIHEFGVPVSRSKLQAIRSVFDGIIIEDAAIALDSRYSDGSPVGQVGNFTIFSGGIGKPVSANSWGGIGSPSTKHLMINHPTKKYSSVNSLIRLICLLFIKNNYVYNLIHPVFTRIVQEEAAHINDEIKLPASLDNKLILHQLKNITFLHDNKYKIGEKVISILKHFNIQTINSDESSLPMYARIPLVLSDQKSCETAIRTFKRHGIEAIKPYSQGYARIDVGVFNNIRQIIDKILVLTIPTLYGHQKQERYEKTLTQALLDFKANTGPCR